MSWLKLPSRRRELLYKDAAKTNLPTGAHPYRERHHDNQAASPILISVAAVCSPGGRRGSCEDKGQKEDRPKTQTSVRM